MSRIEVKGNVELCRQDYQFSLPSGVPTRQESEKIASLIELGVRLVSLGSYREEFYRALEWSDGIKHGPQVLDSLIKRINTDFGGEILDTKGHVNAFCREFPYPDEVASLLKVDEKKIAHWLNIVRKREEKVLNHPDYQETLIAYHSGDQQAVCSGIPKIFTYSKRDAIAPSATPEELYHGVKMQPSETPKSYVEKLISIINDGLLCSPAGFHHTMDAYLRPIFTVSDPNHTHGIAYFKIKPEGYALFANNLMDPVPEVLIYAPRVPVVELIINRSTASILNSEAFKEIHSHRTPEELDGFIGAVIKELETRGIPFEIKQS